MYLGDANKKRCIRCEQVKEISSFHRNSCSKDGHSSYCKLCTKNMGASRHVIHPNTILKQNILSKTNGRCLICGTESNIKVHHILPRTMGGKDIPENLIPLCHECHLKAHNGSFSSGTLNQELLYRFKDFIYSSDAVI